MTVLVKRAATLQQTLALKAVPPNGTAWHHLLLQGLPYGSLRSVAKTLGMKEAELAAHLGLKGSQLAARKRARRLQAAESNTLYVMALAYVKLAGFKSPEEARAWMTSPCEALKGARPIDFLRTRIGAEYVMIAIDRMRPAPALPRRVVEEEEEQEEELA